MEDLELTLLDGHERGVNDTSGLDVIENESLNDDPALDLLRGVDAGVHDDGQILHGVVLLVHEDISTEPVLGDLVAQVGQDGAGVVSMGRSVAHHLAPGHLHASETASRFRQTKNAGVTSVQDGGHVAAKSSEVDGGDPRQRDELLVEAELGEPLDLPGLVVELDDLTFSNVPRAAGHGGCTDANCHEHHLGGADVEAVGEPADPAQLPAELLVRGDGLGHVAAELVEQSRDDDPQLAGIALADDEQVLDLGLGGLAVLRDDERSIGIGLENRPGQLAFGAEVDLGPLVLGDEAAKQTA